MTRNLVLPIITLFILIAGCNNQREAAVDQHNSFLPVAQATEFELRPRDYVTELSAGETEFTTTGGSAEQMKRPAARPTSVDGILNALWQGNKRFVEGRSIHPHESASYRASLSNEQHPFATVLACSDSRVTPVLIFDQGIGDLFVIRVAGNIVDEDVAGSIEYAVDHLSTRLLVVMGHENCGAVTASYHAFVARDLDAHEPHEIESLLTRIEPALRQVDRSKSEPEQIAQGVEEQVRHAIRQLLQIPDLEHAQNEGRLKVVGAVYSLRTGEVRLLDQ